MCERLINHIIFLLISLSFSLHSTKIDTSYYYTDSIGQNQQNNQNQQNQTSSSLNTTTITTLNQDIRSPLAATRANSLASAASPTGSACTKSDTSASDMFLV